MKLGRTLSGARTCYEDRHVKQLLCLLDLFEGTIIIFEE